MRTLALSNLIFDHTVSFRDSLDLGTVERYREAVDSLPPLSVVETPEGLVVGDGFHRGAALRLAGRTEADCDVMSGVRDDAVVIAATANARHGTPLAMTERNSAIVWLVGQGKSNADIGAIYGLKPPAISKIAMKAGVRKQKNERKDKGVTRLRVPSDISASDNGEATADSSEPMIPVEELYRREEEAVQDSAAYQFAKFQVDVDRLRQHPPSDIVDKMTSEQVEYMAEMLGAYIEFATKVREFCRQRLEIFS